VDAVVECGALIAEAKADLPHGEFQAMVERDLPFGARAAQMLMAVAANPWITNHGSHLPASWRTLYELARHDPATLQAALAVGWITPTMERVDAKIVPGVVQVFESLGQIFEKHPALVQWQELEEPLRTGARLASKVHFANAGVAIAMLRQRGKPANRAYGRDFLEWVAKQ
jgi:hypothetical protein